jgi:hypothetical protein
MNGEEEGKQSTPLKTHETTGLRNLLRTQGTGTVTRRRFNTIPVSQKTQRIQLSRRPIIRGRVMRKRVPKEFHGKMKVVKTVTTHGRATVRLAIHGERLVAARAVLGRAAVIYREKAVEVIIASGTARFIKIVGLDHPPTGLIKMVDLDYPPTRFIKMVGLDHPPTKFAKTVGLDHPPTGPAKTVGLGHPPMGLVKMVDLSHPPMGSVKMVGSNHPPMGFVKMVGLDHPPMGSLKMVGSNHPPMGFVKMVGLYHPPTVNHVGRAPVLRGTNRRALGASQQRLLVLPISMLRG